MNTILVTGATGNVGRHLIQDLVSRGAAVRAFVRDPGKARELFGSGIELSRGDYGDPVSIAAALAGVDRVFLLTPSHPHMVRREGVLVQAAAAAKVRRIVKMSRWPPMCAPTGVSRRGRAGVRSCSGPRGSPR